MTTITKDLIASLLVHHTVNPPMPEILAGRLAEAIVGAQRIMAERMAVVAAHRAETDRHEAAMAALRERTAKNQASCPHPATAVHRGAMAGESYRECEVCGANLRKDEHSRRAKNED